MKNNKKDISFNSGNSTISSDVMFNPVSTLKLVDHSNIKKGRPKFNVHKQLLSESISAVIEHDNEVGIYADKMNMTAKTKDEGDEIRKSNFEVKGFVNNILQLEDELKQTSCKNKHQELKSRIKTAVSNLRTMTGNDTYKVGAPEIPPLLRYARAKQKYDNTIKLLNQYEFENNLKKTTVIELKKLAVERKNKRLGRNKKTEIDNLDSTILEQTKIVNNLKFKILTHQLSEDKKNKFKHDLEMREKILSQLKNKVKFLEKKMTPIDLAKRYLNHALVNANNCKNKLDKENNEKNKEELNREHYQLMQIVKRKRRNLDSLISDDKQNNVEQKNSAVNEETQNNDFSQQYSSFISEINELVKERQSLDDKFLKLVGEAKILMDQVGE